MAYINVDEFKRKLIDEKNFFPAIVARALDEMPPADVLPRAEVEKIFAEIDLIFRKYYEEYSEKSDLKLLEPIRQAERFIINEMWHEFAELKKKYIGDKR